MKQETQGRLNITTGVPSR